MSKKTLFVSASAVLLSVAQVFGASFIVPTDRELVQSAKAIVIGSALGSYVLAGDDRVIYTVYQLRVEEVLKGDLRVDRTLEVMEPGGCLNAMCIAAPGAPEYRQGERALVFLEEGRQNRWSTWSMVLGKFNFVHDVHGKQLLIRGGDDGEIFGWDALGNRHVEPLRNEEPFLDYVRAVACGQPAEENYLLDRQAVTFAHSIRPEANAQNFHASNYVQSPGRWKCIFDQPAGSQAGCGGNGSVTFRLVGTATGVNGPGAASAGMAAWNGDALSNVSLLGTVASVAFTPGDGVSSIHFDDDTDVNGPGRCGAQAIGCTLFAWDVSNPYTFDGTTFDPMADADIAMKTSFTANQSLYNQVMTHELGHAIGFRHSDAGTPSTTAAIMVTTANGNSPFGAVLQQWDHDAVSTLYNPSPGGSSCTNPSISVQPQSQTITAGQQATLTVTAAGTSPTFQWFTGNPPGTAISGQTGASLTVTPSSTTTYYVAVTACSTTVNSSAATVTVNPAVCNPVAITVQPQSTSVSLGQTALLSVGVSGTSPFSFQWFSGNPPTGTAVSGGNGQFLSIGPSVTTTYFVKVTNCSGANTATSSAATVTVVPGSSCTPAGQVAASASPASINPGQQVALQAAVGAGTQPFSFQWFRGTAPDQSNPIPGATSFSITDSPAATTSYWLKVTNCNGANAANSNTVTVTVAAGNTCVAPNITANPQSGTILARQTTTLTVAASGTNLHYAWFQGTTSVGSDSPSFTTSPLFSDAQFSVKVTNDCGNATSQTATVTVKPARRRSAHH